MIEKQDFYDDLPDFSINQLREIEDEFGNKIQFEYHDKDLSLKASVSPDKEQPIISCRNNYSPSLDDIIHEIWHLFMKSKLNMIGYNLQRDFGTFFTELCDHSEDKRDELFMFLYSTIEHGFFFHKMIDEGFDPYNNSEFELPTDINLANTINAGNSNLDTMHMSVYILLLLIMQRDKVEGVDLLMPILKSNTISWHIGQNLFNVIDRFKNIEEEPKIMEECLEILTSYQPKINMTTIKRYYVFN
ncbi:hypothetical protein [Winogradskyella sp.]|uniref:hypothetical protein n=1 Tax=Winogradskyella sp. TaxID=1883156 RepID=UPI003AB181B6